MGLGSPRRLRLRAKLALALALAGLADLFFYDQTPGSTFGLFALAMIV